MDRMAAILCFTAAVFFAASPFVNPGFDGFDTAAFPVPLEDPPVQPAGWAFAIWGLIYLWLVAGTAFGLFARFDSDDWAAMRWPLTGSLVLGAAWLGVAQLSAIWATVLIWAMLALALLALARTGRTDRLWQEAPVALYAGWLTAASCVGLGVVLGGYGVLAPVPTALAMLALALGIALAVQLRVTRAPEYGAAVIWALAGVTVANLSRPEPLVAALAGAGAIAVAAAVVLRRR
ncbi:hypothetical protein [Rhodosalinus sp. 5P4]|uniref:hypothetical protein n=1 Tax=Rhodosalinus sp. 5P4 TaxID=3239196 RepID=UPI003523BE40